MSSGERLHSRRSSVLYSAYDIELFVGTHGVPTHPIYGILARPTKKEHAFVAEFVRGMGPGDTMLAEAYGYDSPEPEMSVKQLRMLDIIRPGFSAGAARAIEAMRGAYEIDTWSYALSLAAPRGVRTLYADCNVAEKKAHLQQSNRIDLRDLHHSSDPKEIALANEVDHKREVSASRVLTDWAVRNVWEAETTPNARRTRIVLVLGSNHENGLETVITDIGLRIARKTKMPFVSDDEHAAEQLSLGNFSGRQTIKNIILPDKP